MIELLSLKARLINFLDNIDNVNFYTQYDLGGDILKSFRGKGLKLSDVNSILLEINGELELDDYQEDVLGELSKMLGDQAHDKLKIDWW